MAKNTYGTGCSCCMNTGTRPSARKHGLLTTVAWSCANAPAEYALEGSVFVGGAAVQWLRDGLGIITRGREVEALAASVPTTAASSRPRVHRPRHAALGRVRARHDRRPHARRDARAHRARRARSRSPSRPRRARGDAADSGIALAELRVDGGASANDLLMQFQADLAASPSSAPARCSETTALGAAYLAGLAVGFWPIELADAHERFVAWWNEPRYGFDLRPMRSFASNSIVFINVPLDAHIAQPASIIDIDFRAATSAFVRGRAQFTASRDCVVHGFGVWFTATITEGITITNIEPGATHWAQGYFPLEHPIAIQRGAAIDVDLESEDGNTWRWRGRAGDEPFDQTTLFSAAPFGPGVR
jgi:hypothetical protein